jgi:hypothetical protein
MSTTSDNVPILNPLDAVAAFIGQHGATLKTEGVALLVYLNSIAQDGIAEATYDDLAEAFGWGRASAVRHMQRLQRLGYVSRIVLYVTQRTKWHLSDLSIILITTKSTNTQNDTKKIAARKPKPAVTRVAPAVVVTQDSPEEELSASAESARAEQAAPVSLDVPIGDGRRIYREVFHRNPLRKYAMKFDEIADAIGVELYRTKLEYWEGRGWSPTNWIDLQDFLLNGTMRIASARASPNGNGHGPRESHAERIAREKDERIQAELESERRREAENGRTIEARPA